MEIRRRILAPGFFLAALLLSVSQGFTQDPNFHIYLAFGQSNMEGQGAISPADQNVDARFQLISTAACGNRTVGKWMTAVPPLFRCDTKLSPVDYFGRTLVEKLPATIKVGVVPVAVAGCGIELFDKVNYQSYINNLPAKDAYMKPMIAAYGGNPYGRLVEVAKLAQKEGVIKGILLHQGESNTGDQQWTKKVKAVYDNLIKDLDLDPTKVPLLAGEVVDAAEGGKCAGANTFIDTLPKTLPNSHVISSKGLPDGGDNLHFSAESYRTFGKRYAEKMLTLLDATPINPPTPEVFWMEAECGTVGANWERVTDAAASNGYFISIKDGMNSTAAAPTAAEDGVVLPFTVDSAQTFRIFARMNAASGNDDSYWIKLDNGAFEMVNDLATSGWEWKALTSKSLTAGNHTLTIGYREDGAKLDKISITNASTTPAGMGEGSTCQVPSVIAIKTHSLGYGLEQSKNNPDKGSISISFETPEQAFVSLKIYSLHGEEVAELAGKNFNAGRHSVEFERNKYFPGLYFYSMKANRFTASRRLLIQMQ